METSTQTYVNPLSDAGFKALLCDPANKQDLIALLNAFLPAGRRVSDLEYATTEIPGVTLSNKASRVDLCCTDTDGRRFIVEVQRSPQPNFFRRCVYYASRIYALGSERGDSQRYDLPPVYLLALTDRDFGFDRGGGQRGPGAIHPATPFVKVSPDRWRKTLFRLSLLSCTGSGSPHTRSARRTRSGGAGR